MIEIFSAEEYPQGSQEWFDLHRGVPSASSFSDVMAGGAGKVRDLYMRKLAGEIISGIPRENYKNGAMDRGNAMEDELRNLFAMLENVDPMPVGFIKRTESFGAIGCSPDSLIGTDGGIEIKSAAPHVLIEILESDKIPTEHLLQIQGSMLVTDRQWWWLAIGYRGMPMFRRRIKRDETTIARLRIGLEQFHRDLAERVASLRQYGKK